MVLPGRDIWSFLARDLHQSQAVFIHRVTLSPPVSTRQWLIISMASDLASSKAHTPNILLYLFPSLPAVLHKPKRRLGQMSSPPGIRTKTLMHVLWTMSNSMVSNLVLHSGILRMIYGRRQVVFGGIGAWNAQEAKLSRIWGMVMVLGYAHNFDSKDIAQSKFLGLRFSPWLEIVEFHSQRSSLRCLMVSSSWTNLPKRVYTYRCHLVKSLRLLDLFILYGPSPSQAQP